MSTLTALLSVSDKAGIIPFAQGLHQLGVRILSTGGTAQQLSDAGIPVTEVASLTGFPEILDGRVKTLHPAIHAGILARRDNSAHLDTLRQHEISLIDLVVVSITPFEITITKQHCSLEQAMEHSDIGLPAM